MRIILLLLYVIAVPPDFKWKDTHDDRVIHIHSLYDLNDKKVATIHKIHNQATNLFFKKFEKDMPSCVLGRLDIKIISPALLNEHKKFNDNTSKNEVFGRYYWRYNILFITEEALEHNEYLAHELAHYFYDECGVFRGVEEEERNAYQFQGLYLKTYENPR